jgi:hypothetical protein
MEQMEWGTEVVLMPVPLRLAEQVAEFVEGLRHGRLVAGLPQPEPDAETAAVPGQGDWSSAMVRELAEAMPYAGVIALFDRCATNPGTWVAKAQVEEAHDISPIQLRNELSALSKLTKRLFGKTVWPIQWKKQQGVYYYRMQTPVAQWWTDARGR